jgi:hypothetical protein
MKSIEIKDLYGKYITLLHPKNTLAQLEVLIEMIETEPALNKNELPAVYWINLHEKLKAAIKENQ